jgi:hypothetical protein
MHLHKVMHVNQLDDWEAIWATSFSLSVYDYTYLSDGVQKICNNTSMMFHFSVYLT